MLTIRNRSFSVGFVFSTGILGCLVGIVLFAYVPKAGANLEGIPNGRVATFAVRALAEVGEVDPTSRLNDYESIAEQSDGWIATFKVWSCTVTDNMESCDLAGSSSLRVMVDGNQLFIADAIGPFDASTRDRLLRYKERITTESFDLQFAFLRIGRGVDEALTVRGVPLWTGTYPTDEGTTLKQCQFSLESSSGEVIYQDELPFPPPISEEQRSGSIVNLGVPNEYRELRPHSASLSCS